MKALLALSAFLSIAVLPLTAQAYDAKETALLNNSAAATGALAFCAQAYTRTDLDETAKALYDTLAARFADPAASGETKAAGMEAYKYLKGGMLGVYVKSNEDGTQTTTEMKTTEDCDVVKTDAEGYLADLALMPKG